jgi:hypothetical protein
LDIAPEGGHAYPEDCYHPAEIQERHLSQVNITQEERVNIMMNSIGGRPEEEENYAREDEEMGGPDI